MPIDLSHYDNELQRLLLEVLAEANRPMSVFELVLRVRGQQQKLTKKDILRLVKAVEAGYLDLVVGEMLKEEIWSLIERDSIRLIFVGTDREDTD